MKDELSKAQLIALVFLRILIGWHFLYEGVVKLYNPAWTSKGYLLSATGPAKGLFTAMAADGVIGVVDIVNMVTLALVGIALLIGLYERAASLVGAGLLILYYAAHPAIGDMSGLPVEGNYWIVNKNLIEAASLFVLAMFPTSGRFGIGVLKLRQPRPLQ